MFMLCGVLNAADMIFKYPLQEFLQYGLPDTLILLVMAGACVIPAGILKKRHDRQNVIRSIIGRRETMQMAQLAAAADLSPKKLRKELQAMIDKGEFGDEAFIDLLEDGKIYVDLRIGQYHDGKNKGKTHDHGTAFRIKEVDQPLLFKNKVKIV